MNNGEKEIKLLFKVLTILMVAILIIFSTGYIFSAGFHMAKLHIESKGLK